MNAKTPAAFHADAEANQAISSLDESLDPQTVDDEPSHTSTITECCDDRLKPPHRKQGHLSNTAQVALFLVSKNGLILGER